METKENRNKYPITFRDNFLFTIMRLVNIQLTKLGIYQNTLYFNKYDFNQIFAYLHNITLNQDVLIIGP